MEILINYHWPGNVRELQNIMERIVVLLEGEIHRGRGRHGSLQPAGTAGGRETAAGAADGK